MKAKGLMASFMTVLAIFVVATTVSAADFTLTAVEVEDQVVYAKLVNDTFTLDEAEVFVTLTAGEKIKVEVEFISNAYADDVTVEVEIEGDDFDLRAESDEFYVLDGEVLRKTLWLELPAELEDKLIDEEVSIEVEVDRDSLWKSASDAIVLVAKRPTYKVDIKAIGVDQVVSAGQTMSVDVVLQNIGFNDLDDVVVTASIPTLNVQRSVYFGDVVALECDDEDEFPWNDTFNRNCDEDDEDSIHGIVDLKLPYDVAEGVHALEVKVASEDTSATKTIQVMVGNEFEENVFKSGNTLHIINPTDSVKGYRIVPESPASVSESIVFVPAGETAKVEVTPNADGQYEFDVSVFTTKGDLVETLTFSGQNGEDAEDSDGTNPVVILTVVLAVIFIVLLIVLIVLIGKKPEKSGEFGESYY